MTWLTTTSATCIVADDDRKWQSADSPGLASDVGDRRTIANYQLALMGLNGRQEDPDAVQQGREALRDASTFPWYDSRNDSIRSMVERDDQRAGGEHRDSDWIAREKPPAQNRAATSTNSDWASLLLTILMWVVISVILLALIGFLVWAFMRHETSQEQDDIDDWLDDPRDDEQRIEALPFEIKRPTSDLMAAAERARTEGNFRLAIVYLFSHMLVQMDRNHRIRLAKGKTNRQYLNEIVTEGSLHEIVATAMLAFERVFFGDHELRVDEFETVWASIGDFEAQVKPARH